MDRFVFLTFDGLSQGAAYAAFALALVLIWRATRIVNFAQGAMAVACAYISYTVTQHTGNFWLGLGAALVAGVVIGVVIEAGVMRFVSHTAPLNAVIVALGTTLVLQAVLSMVYTTDVRAMERPLSRDFRFPFGINGLALPSDYDLYVFGAVLVMV